jgi:uroporphyrinogen-III decarboxylase
VGNFCRALHITGPVEPLLPHYETIRGELANLDYDVDILRVAAAWPNLAIHGNIRPILLQESSPEVLLEECNKLLPKMSCPGRFILSPGCEAPLGTVPDNLFALCSSVRSGAGNSSDDFRPRLTVTRCGSESAIIEAARVKYGAPLVAALRRYSKI